MDLSTALIHPDIAVQPNEEITPSISVSTIFDLGCTDTNSHVYSRYRTPTRDILEKSLSVLEGKDAKALTYASGLAAAHAVVMFVKPKRIFSTKGYYGVQHVFEEISSFAAVELHHLTPSVSLQPNDLIWIETPLNNDCTLTNVSHYVDLRNNINKNIHNKSEKIQIVIDATFAPPPLQSFLDKFGVDIVLHSGTKYLNGHSDTLIGVLLVKCDEKYKKLFDQRCHFGATSGSLETWLCLRSLKTLELRVMKQSCNALIIALLFDFISSKSGETRNCFEAKELELYIEQFGFPEHILYSVKFELFVVHKLLLEVMSFEKLKILSENLLLIKYPALLLKSKENRKWIINQMPNGFGGMFFIELKKRTNNKEFTLSVVKKCKLWRNATSLGGVESLIDLRYRWQKDSPENLLRLSTGIESAKDLIVDLVSAILDTDAEQH